MQAPQAHSQQAELSQTEQSWGQCRQPVGVMQKLEKQVRQVLESEQVQQLFWQGRQAPAWLQKVSMQSVQNWLEVQVRQFCGQNLQVFSWRQYPMLQVRHSSELLHCSQPEEQDAQRLIERAKIRTEITIFILLLKIYSEEGGSYQSNEHIRNFTNEIDGLKLNKYLQCVVNDLYIALINFYTLVVTTQHLFIIWLIING